MQQRLQDALAMHEELTAQTIDLEERHTEVLAMLRDAEEELRTYRQNQSAYRLGFFISGKRSLNDLTD